MVHNSLPVAAVNAPPLSTNPSVTSPDKNAAAKGQFKSIYLSLPILESRAAEDALQTGTNAGAATIKPAATKPPAIKPAAIKNTTGTNPNSPAAVTPVPPSPNPLPIARALALALSSQPAEEQPSLPASNAGTSAEATVEPVAKTDGASQYVEAGLLPREANIPAPSLSNSAPPEESVSKWLATPGSSASPLSPAVPSTAPQPAEHPQAPKGNSATAPPEGAVPPEVYQSATAKVFVSTAPDAIDDLQKDADRGRIRSQAPAEAQASFPLAGIPSAQTSAPPLAASQLSPSGQQLQNAKAGDSSSTATASKSSAVADPQNLAFSLHLEDQNSSEPREQEPQPVDTRADAPDAKRPEPPAASTTVSNVTGEAGNANLLKEYSNAGANLPLSEVSTAARLEIEPAPSMSQPPEVPHVPAAVAVHDAQPVLADSPKLNMSGEIILNIQGNDQSAAAIRVVDRAGALNVSVHASDTELRNALRSNVGELVSQLNGQGWKTEVDKPGLAAVRAQTAQDPQSGDQRSPGQQHSSSNSERQPPRDRRSNSGRWLEELQQQTSGNPGGKN